ncbi:membrane-bound serine protease (ClpP class) [Anaerospora hongkongensis]|uniref:Membrane-bound serine protease (ClpP class) n=1 Tax=Anaerospora hongkongensis TaxID=244830 RepID=A0A4R1PVT4_9FIRM|nr:NfeD family protein [Anaerospora hongkongensis]TCL36373.1 membrane-bound serine protease (ClpP class) [Anaerospora hongkongensis]
MERIRRIFLLFLCLALWVTLGVSAAVEPASSVAVVTIKGEIDGGQSALLQRAFQEAQKNNARAILVELDTFGGLVDAAVQMRDVIIDSPVPTICYIKNRAWSAGALIALAHQSIAVAPGGSIGAAEPIPTTEKTVAALKAEFAATANKTGRNPRVAEAMVDKSLGLPGYAEPGQILALTDYQAKDVGFADFVAVDRAAVLAHYGFSDATVVEYQPQWTDRLAGWLSNPAIKSGLLSLIFLAVLAEIKTAGTGVGALVAIVAAVLFFGSQWLTGVAGLLEILLFAAGCILLVVELYVPGTGLFGIAGLASILASFFLSLGANLSAVTTMTISLVVAIIAFAVLARYLPSSKLWTKLILKDSETTQAGYTSAQDYDCYLGCEGITITQLRPAGRIELKGVQLDVVSEGRFLPAGIPVKVVSVKGNRIVVHPIVE